MATVPTFDSWTAGEKPTALKMTTNIKDSGNFFLGVPFAWAYRTGALSLATSSWTEVTLDTEKTDNDAMYATSNAYISIVTPGWYFVEAGTRFATNTTGSRGCRIRLNGADADVAYSPGAADGNTVRATTYVDCVAGDQLTVGAYQSSGSSLALSVAQAHYTFLRARWVAA